MMCAANSRLHRFFVNVHDFTQSASQHLFRKPFGWCRNTKVEIHVSHNLRIGQSQSKPRQVKVRERCIVLLVSFVFPVALGCFCVVPSSRLAFCSGLLRPGGHRRPAGAPCWTGALGHFGLRKLSACAKGNEGSGDLSSLPEFRFGVL